MTPYDIVLADDHVLFRRAVKKIIERIDGLVVADGHPFHRLVFDMAPFCTRSALLALCDDLSKQDAFLCI